MEIKINKEIRVYKETVCIGLAAFVCWWWAVQWH